MQLVSRSVSSLVRPWGEVLEHFKDVLVKVFAVVV